MENIKNLKKEKVEWKILEEVCKFQNGFAFPSNLFSSTGIPVIKINNVSDGKVKFDNYKCFESETLGINLEEYKILPNDILITMTGTTKIGYNYSENIGYLNQRVGKIIPFPEKIKNRFLFHLLLFFENKIYKLATGAGPRPNLSAEQIKSFKVPLPPLKKQAKIAAALDKFTELTEELTAELTGREAQYDYYRNLLLSEEYIDKKRSQFVKIKEICIKQKGINITAKEMKQLNKKNTPIKIFGGGNTSVTVDKKDINVDIISKPSIIVKSRGNIDFEFYDKPFTHKNELWSYSSKNNNLLNIKYLYYYLKNEIEYFKNKAIHGRMPQISNGITDNYSFYLPPIETQNKIIKFLDSFEALVNDIKQGLPKEIELRQKQYKYYREKLLTF